MGLGLGLGFGLGSGSGLAHLVAHLEGLCHGGVLALLGLAPHARLGIVEGRLVRVRVRVRVMVRVRG